jgi:hypothetical protein
MTLAKHWLCLSNTTHYMCRTNMAPSGDCYVALSLNWTAPVESDHHRRVAHFSYALQALSICRDHHATFEPIVHVVWIYRVPRLPSHNCTCYKGLLCCCCPDGRTHVDARYARACTRMECGGLFKSLKSHYYVTFVNNFVWLYILFDCVVWHHIFICIAKWP